MLVHPTKSVKAALGQEHPQAVTEHPPLCQGRGPSQECHHRVLDQRSSSR
jgi:hypothetical protein